MIGQIPECSVEGCEGTVRVKGYCKGHYNRVQRHGDPQADKPLRPIERVQPDICTIKGCMRPTKAKGYCATHYKRFRIHGTPQPDRPIHRHNRPGGTNWSPKKMAEIAEQEEKRGK